ncbi:MAG: hypothetical protein WCK42_09745, partial [Myxococcaceae bacterium]
LGFDVPDGDLYSPVKYCRTRLPIPLGRKLEREDLDDLLLTKFSAWRYETEYRCFCLLDHSIHENGLYFEPFSPKLKLVEVIIGNNATISRAELAVALGAEKTQIRSFRARPSSRTFSIVRNRDTTLW